MFALSADLAPLFSCEPLLSAGVGLLGGLGACWWPCCGGGGCSKAYAWGGISRPTTSLADNDEYDPDTWTNKTDLPSPARYLGYGSHSSGKAYSFFGQGTSGPFVDTDEYDPDTWTAKTNGPAPARDGGGAASLDDAIYCCHGEDSGGLGIKDTDQYVPDTWISKTDSPNPERLYNAISATANFVYATAGNNLGADLSDHDVYDAGGNSWASLTNIPSPARTFPSATIIDLDICLMAGENHGLGSFKRDTDTYNETGATWTSRTDCPLPARARCTAQTVDSAAYLYGGLTSGTTDIQDNDEFVIDTWTSKTDLPTPARDELYSACL